MAMKAYESYKNVDLPWLKRVPEHWEVKRIGSLFSQRIEKVSDKVYAPLSVTKYGIVPQLSDAAKTNNGDDRKLVCIGDFVINSRSDRKGSSGLSQLEGSVAKINLVLKPRTTLAGEYIHYLLKSNSFIEEYYRNGRGIVADLWTTGFSDMKTIWLPVPPKEEQEQIVRYLDWQNSRLNKLINAKKKEIALLEEQKQALISQAVTKGLNPHAPLKDSGIDWIGQIPEHWEINRLKDVSTLKTGSTPKTQFTEYFNGDIPWFTPGDFSSNILNTAERTLTQKAKFDGAATIIPPNSILLICIGGTVGKVGLSTIECSCNQQITAFTNLKCDSKYLLYWLLGNKVHLKGTASYTTLPILNNQTVGNYPFIAPCEFTIQHEIANHLDKKCFTIDAAINNINKTISLLQEYRTRLVADVVTGQIDVRHIAIPNYETITETIDQPEADEDSTICTEDQ